MSHMRPSVLIVSNGYGEDAVGNALARDLGNKAEVVAYPLVGLGHAYLGVRLLNPRKDLPSGGFGLRGSWGTFLADLREGSLGLWHGQRKTLRGHPGKHTRVVAIGDVFCLWLAAHAASPAIFVATAKSEYNERHRLPEIWLLRRHAALVFTRDQPTAVSLAARGVTARYAGNPLMDTIPAPEAPLPLPAGAPVILLLPGSRADALQNLRVLLKVCLQVHAEAGAAFVCSLPPTLEVVTVVRNAMGVGWEAEGQYVRSGQTRVLLTRDFGSAVRSATIAVGLAGTANEQVAGLGKPVVAFPGPGTQYTAKFMNLQARLLGEALVPTPDWREAAEAVLRLLDDSSERARRGQAGLERMGSPGAIKSIAEEILKRPSD